MTMTQAQERPSILAAYAAATPNSARAQARAEKYMPGGNSRQAGYWAPHPLTIERGEGIHLIDVDGRRYIDLTNNYTSLVHGHAYPPIVEAVSRQVAAGTAWSANNSAQSDLAEAILDRAPAMERIRFTNSGTEAGNLALLMARQITGRYKILMARYGYHGALLEFEVGAFDLEGPATFVARYNDAVSFAEVLNQHGDEIAAVFVEPMMGAGGVVVAERDFLVSVREAAHRVGALFILDEVISFRLALGGRQTQIDVAPDLTMLGKLIGGGFPVGAVAGRAEHFKMFDPADLKAWHSGTFNANPVTMRAGAVAVRDLRQTKIDAMAQLAERLEGLLRVSARKRGLPISVNRCGSLLNVFLMDTPPAATLLREDQKAISLFHLAAMNHGVFVAARGMMALSTIMTERLIDEVGDRCDAAFADVAASL